MPGRPSKLSRALADVRLQLKSGKTRGQNPRDLDPDEIAALEKTRGVLEAKGKQKAKERAISRINAHTTSEADRVIKAVEEASKPANTYFDAVGGAGSSTDLRLQGKALIERAKEKDRQAKRQATEERRAAAKAEKQRQRIKRGTETEKQPRAKRARKEADGSGGGDGPGAPAELPEDELALIRNGYHPGFVEGQLLADMLRLTDAGAPHTFLHRGKPVKSLPKIIYGVRDEATGEYPLFRTGKQDKSGWGAVQNMPEPLLAVAALIEEKFSVPRPNHVWANYYLSGAEYWIPVHQEQAFSRNCRNFESEGTTFIVSVGASRPLIITDLASKGATDRAGLNVLAEAPMDEGALYALTGPLNVKYAHGVPRDASVAGRRVTYVFRRVENAVVNPERRYYRELQKGGTLGPQIPLPEEPAAAPQVGLPNTISLAPTREVKLNAGLLRELGMVDDSGRLTQLRSTTLIEPLLALALLRNIKKHEMRPKKFPAGPYLIHVGGAKTPPGYKDMLEQEWPDHPPYGSNPCSAIYGLMYLEEPVAAESLDDPWAHLSTWGMRGAWGIEFETPVLQVAGARGVWYLKDETLIAGVQQALVGATLRTFPAGSP